MKKIAYLALLGVTWAVKIAQKPTSLVVMNAMESCKLYYNPNFLGKSEDDLQKLVDEAVKNAKLSDAQLGKEALVKAGELKAIEKALAERIYERIIDTGLYRPVLGSVYYRPTYYYPYYSTYTLPYSLEAAIARVLSFHDYINRYEVENRVINYVTDPALTEILGVMYDLMNKNKGAEAKKEEAKPAGTKTLSQTSDNNQTLVIANSKVAAKELLKGISEEAMQKMVDTAIANAKNKPPEDKNALEKDGQMRAIESLLADQIINRIISEGYWRPSWSSPYYRPYYPAYREYLTSDLDYEVRRILSYHDYINRYELLNRVLGHTYDPKLEEILGVLYDLVNKKDAATGTASANATKKTLSQHSLLQTSEQGVPVFVDPTLVRNDMGDADLQQREYIIDGVSGISFAQT